MNSLYILIAGGGTGGHIFPGISLYNEFKKNSIQAGILVGKKDAHFTPLEALDGKDVFYYRAPSFTNNIIKMPLFFLRFIKATLNSLILIKKLKADAVIGMGGYVSAPVLTAALVLKRPVFLCEQNSVPGKVTVFFASKARKIFTTFSNTNEFLKDEVKAKILNYGNPLRDNVFTRLTKQEARKIYYLGHCNKVILVIGGSQGAVQINELFLNIKRIYAEELKNTGFIWVTGNLTYKKYKDALNQMHGDGSVYVSPFIENIGTAYKASDLVISRAGSGGMMEIAATGLPSILIPYPYAADNHQEKNAENFEKAGAAVKAGSTDVEPEKIGNIVINLLSNPAQLSRMAEKARSMAQIEAAGNIMNFIVKELDKTETV
ncbi:MAG: UDP-N-acetylglucosamine--N-acetylmuramyl-(pentapeptide) pyrophosphoryl-undecaprenol N-acetylglucosamine transferase [Spirochaetes bacterium]|nr:UDP-N-acetylglucosamine--N-acetylmuramyl-(pentapeptide) pyrophosphoryl-undecaprenol N-acetylglucosamine transferase [Spirochaetota bacterium]